MSGNMASNGRIGIDEWNGMEWFRDIHNRQIRLTDERLISRIR